MKEMNAAVVVPPASLREQQFEERWRLFQDFLRSPLNDIKESGEKDGSLTYEQRLQTFIEQKPSPISPSDVDNRRFLINLNDVRTFNVEAAQGLLQTPLEWIPAMERAVQEVCLPFSGQLSNTTSAYAYAYGKRDEKVRIGFEGAFGELHTSPRGLTSRFLGHLVCMDGIVTSCSLVRPKLVRSVHYSEHVNGFMAKEYSDATQVAPTNIRALGNNTYPTEDEHQRKLLSEFGLSTFRDSQTVTVQEMPERMPPGQLPRAIDVLLTDDLVDAVKPGDRVRVVGVYKALAGVFNGVAPGTFRALLIANHLKQLRHGNYSAGNAEMLTAKETALIRTLSRRKDIFSLLSRSLAPSIFGHDKIKQAVLLMLLSGAERNFATSGTHLRGDINILLIGDPSTAKSQMLRFVLGMAPLAIATTGRGSSGVGLTAAVVSDKETGERRLEAGAMVLADRGIVCIDEFDKMSEQDRVAIHEVMEQQTVTIAKAGIHTTLNARCSVLAAANPVRGQYVPTESPQWNIGLPDSLLSRFDLLFIVVDECDPETDRRVASHVLRLHRQPRDSNRYLEEEGGEEEEGGNARAEDLGDEERIFVHYGIKGQEERLTVDFVKKYLRVCKDPERPLPSLTQPAADLIAQAYTEFRQRRELQQAQWDLIRDNVNEGRDYGPVAQRVANALPVTARTLETMIRLATAHAKARLSLTVDRQDANVAISLVNHCLWHETQPKAKRGKKKARSNDADEDGDGHYEDGDHDDDPNKGDPNEDEEMEGADASPQFGQLSISPPQAEVTGERYTS